MTSDNSVPPAAEPEKLPWHLSVLGRLRAYFFAGILVTAPVSITFYIAWKFILFMDNSVSPLIPPTLNPKNWGIPGFGLVAVVVSLTLIGALTAGFAGRMLVRLYDAILERMPVLRGIYSAVKQIFETMLAQKANAFREVALIEYPRKGIWTLAFITGTPKGDEVEAATLAEAGLGHAWVNASKSVLGHGLSAAGAVEVAAVLLQMRAGRLHATRNLEQPVGPPLRQVMGAAVTQPVRHALKTSFGFGGTDAALVIRGDP